MKENVIKLEKGESITTTTVMDLLENEGGITFDGYDQYTVAHNIKIIIKKEKR